jgi:plastocyanin
MRLAREGRLRLQLLGIALLVSAGAEGAHAQDATAVVRGSVVLAEGISVPEAGPVVAYLEPLSVAAAPRAPQGAPVLRQKHARFAPGFMVVSAGESVKMPNEDAIYHNVFSYSKPNEFDLGLYPPSASRSVKLLHPGVVKIYCSIHQSMSAIILVTPTSDFARVKSSGKFEIRDVQPGRYRLHVWSEKLPEQTRSMSIAAGETVRVKVEIGGAGP